MVTQLENDPPAGTPGDSPGPDPAPGKPKRRRRVWRVLRRLALGCLLLVLVLLAAHWAWGRVAAGRLADAVAEFERAGEPMTAVALNGAAPAVRPEDNAAPELRAAAARVQRDDPAWREASRSMDMAPPLGDEELDVARKALAGHDETLRLVRAARLTRPAADWQVPVRSPIVDMRMPDLGAQRELAVTLGLAALAAHADGDDAGAVELVGDLLFVSRCGGHLPGLVPHLVAVGVRRLACDRAGQITPGLLVADGGGPTGRYATAAQVDALVRELLDEAPLFEGYRRALRVERVMQLEIARGVGDGSMTWSALTGTRGGREMRLLDALVGYAAKPTAYDDGRLMLRQTTAVMAAVEESDDWPAAKGRVEGLRDEVQAKWWLHLVASVFMPSYERATGVNYEAAAEARLAAAALAARRYALDHDGRLPEALGDLVPRYLPAVPLDPLAAGEAPLSYVNDKADGARPRVYSVGLNGADDGGIEPDADAPRFLRDRTGDVVRDLKRRPRAAPRAEP